MDQLVLLISLLSAMVTIVAMVHMHRLAGMAPSRHLRLAWLAMMWLLATTIGLGTYGAFDRYVFYVADRVDVVEAISFLLGAGFILSIVLLSRLTARDMLKVAELETAAYTDTLTGLSNRRAFDAALPRQIEIARRRHQPLALISLDIDHFKRVNDEYGHEWGDEVLRHLGSLLAANARSGEAAYRIGGEEFAILAPRADIGLGRAIAERLRLVIEKSSLSNGERCTAITVSFGVAVLRAEDDVSSLAARADQALYRAKRTGRNRVCTENTAATPPEPAPGP